MWWKIDPDVSVCDSSSGILCLTAGHTCCDCTDQALVSQVDFSCFSVGALLNLMLLIHFFSPFTSFLFVFNLCFLLADVRGWLLGVNHIFKRHTNGIKR